MSSYLASLSQLILSPRRPVAAQRQWGLWGKVSDEPNELQHCMRVFYPLILVSVED